MNDYTNQTLIVIAGGCKVATSEHYDVTYSNEIYFAMSDDLFEDNIWQKSIVLLPKPMARCKCIIAKDSKEPKLYILGGEDNDGAPLNIHFEVQLSDVLGQDRFNRFWQG